MPSGEGGNHAIWVHSEGMTATGPKECPNANVLNKFPKSMHPAGKADLREIWQAETRAPAEAAMDTFVDKYGAKYDKTVTCLTKDRDALLAFYAFPADRWDHLRTGTLIESVFTTVRHRTVRTKGALSQKTAKLMVLTGR